MFERGYPALDEFSTLIQGRTVSKEISDQVTLRDLVSRSDGLCSLLFFTGYLTAHRATLLSDGSHRVELTIPNVDLRYVFEESVRSWMNSGLSGADRLDRMLDAMLHG